MPPVRFQIILKKFRKKFAIQKCVVVLVVSFPFIYLTNQ